MKKVAFVLLASLAPFLAVNAQDSAKEKIDEILKKIERAGGKNKDKAKAEAAAAKSKDIDYIPNVPGPKERKDGALARVQFKGTGNIGRCRFEQREGIGPGCRISRCKHAPHAGVIIACRRKGGKLCRQRHHVTRLRSDAIDGHDRRPGFPEIVQHGVHSARQAPVGFARRMPKLSPCDPLIIRPSRAWSFRTCT